MPKTKKLYCGKCNKFVNANITSSIQTHKVFNEEIKMKTEYYVCPNCKKELYDETQDSKTLNTLYDIYRKNHNLLSPKQIKEIRSMYDLSQTEFSKLLGWGEKTICRYEGGSIQDNSHNDLLVLLKEAYVMNLYIKNKKNQINEKTYNKILKVLNNSNTQKRAAY